MRERMRHFLYFPQKPDAENAVERLRKRGFSAKVLRGATGENWLAFATKAPPRTDEQMEELRSEMEALALELGGEYDGWERVLDFADPESGSEWIN
jgi:hypothetical protein